jgi:S-adenosylhomocysteine hydrolase
MSEESRRQIDDEIIKSFFDTSCKVFLRRDMSVDEYWRNVERIYRVLEILIRSRIPCESRITKG